MRSEVEAPAILSHSTPTPQHFILPFYQQIHSESHPSPKNKKVLFPSPKNTEYRLPSPFFKEKVVEGRMRSGEGARRADEVGNGTGVRSWLLEELESFFSSTPLPDPPIRLNQYTSLITFPNSFPDILLSSAHTTTTKSSCLTSNEYNFFSK